MSLRFIIPFLCGTAALFQLSCGPSDGLPLRTGNNPALSAEGESLFNEAKQADDEGNTNRAIKLYAKTATRYPFTASAPKARFRQAELLEQKGDTVDAFEAYQQFLIRFQGSNLYTTALNRQAAMAQSAAAGEVKSNFLGVRYKLSSEKTTEMLGQVRDNAPKSAAAAKAQFTIGEIHQSKRGIDQADLAIAAYRKLVRDQPASKEAPEALFRIGLILIDKADRGNQNQATLELAREAFNDYLNQYPGHPRNAEARKLISSLGSRQLDRSFEVAEYYFKTRQFESAKVYYRDIVRNSPSGQLHDAASARLKELGE